MKIVALLPIKSHSSRVINKNFKNFCGKPLYQWVLDTLLSIKEIDKIIINTDAEQLLKNQLLLNNNKIILRKRKKLLVGDFVSMNKIIKDDIDSFKANLYLMTHATNPLITKDYIESAIKLLKKNDKKYDSLMSYNAIKSRVYDKDLNPLNHLKHNVIRTQDLNEIVEENSNLYIFSRESYYKNNSRIGDNPILHESKKDESIDIDDTDNWKIAEALMTLKLHKNPVLNLKIKIKNHQLVIGTWLTLAHESIAEILSSKEFDFITIDLEHSSISINETERLIRVISLKNRVPLVRLTSNNGDLIKRVMDSGAGGVIVPMVKTVSDVKKTIQSLYYPSNGSRSVGLARAQGYGNTFDNYLDNQKNSLLIIQVEHIDCVKNLSKILSLSEVDTFIVGPYDLSASMGIPGEFNNPKFKKIIDKIVKIAKSKNKPYGFHIIEPNKKDIQSKIKEGYKFLAYSLDIRALSYVYDDLLNLKK